MDNAIFDCLDQEVQKNSKEQIAFLQKLIQTKSANPFTPEKSKPETPIEKEVANLIYDQLIKIGLQPKFDGVSPYRPNVVATIKGGGDKTLILNGHMDTVLPSQANKYDPFGGVIVDNRLYGLGALDMKASLSVFIYAAKALKECAVKLGGNLVLTFVVDEEPGGCSKFGTDYLLRNGLRGTAAIVAEPGNRHIATGHRGGYRFKITVYGQAVHTGFISWEKGERGRNAIIDMAKVIHACSGIEIPYTETPAFLRRKSVMTFPTLIEGGTSINTVPEKCTAYGDCRLLRGSDSSTIANLIKNKLDQIPDLNYELQNIMYVPTVEIFENEEIVEILRRRSFEVVGQEPTIGGVGPWNDGWMFITRNIPAVCGFGPNGKGVHSPDEFVYIDSVIDTTKIYVRTVVDYLGIV